MQVLVVDDSRTVRRILRTVLEEAGFTVREAEDGRVALHMLDQHPEIELVITDWDMPQMDGLTLLQTLRSHPDYGELPVLMVTQESRASHVREAMEAGASAYLMKPFNRAMLLEKLTEIGCTGGSTGPLEPGECDPSLEGCNEGYKCNVYAEEGNANLLGNLGCFPLDPHYKELDDARELARLKRAAREEG